MAPSDVQVELKVALPDVVLPAATLLRDSKSSLVLFRPGTLVGRTLVGRTLTQASPEGRESESSARALVGAADALASGEGDGDGKHEMAVEGSCLLCCCRADDWRSGLAGFIAGSHWFVAVFLWTKIHLSGCDSSNTRAVTLVLFTSRP